MIKRALSDRSLFLVEAVLVLGLVKEAVSDTLMAETTIPPWGRVLLVMALTVGLFGTLFLWLERWTKRALSKAQKLVKRRAGVPRLAMHGLVLTTLFVGYLWMFEPETGSWTWVLQQLPTGPWSGT